MSDSLAEVERRERVCWGWDLSSCSLDSRTWITRLRRWFSCRELRRGLQVVLETWEEKLEKKDFVNWLVSKEYDLLFSIYIWIRFKDDRD